MPGKPPMRGICIYPVKIDAEIRNGDSLARMLADSRHTVDDGSILVVSQKAVSKSEGRIVRLADVKPSVLACGIASEYDKDPRIVELVMSEAKRIVRIRSGIIITQTHHGFICANSGVDESNMPEGHAALLPRDPDASARRIRAEVADACGARVGVIISDTFGRAFRTGQTDCAIGVAGVRPAQDYIGTRDIFGRTLRSTLIATADEVAGAAEIVMRKVDMCPMAIVCGTGIPVVDEDVSASSLIRPERDDLFM